MNYILGNKIKSIETPSEYSVKINLNKPSSSLNGLLTSVNLTPISPTFYKEYSDKFLNEKFVGTGKYVLTSFSNEVQSIDPYLNYWGEKPLNNLNLRLALAKSLNRKLISEKVSYGLRKPSRSIIPPILKKDNQELWPKYDYLEARKLLQKENYCDGNILKIPLTYRSNVPADKLIALTWQEEIKNSLKDCIDIELNGVESTTVYKNLSLGIYTAVILDWTGAYSDPEAYLTPLSVSYTHLTLPTKRIV